MIKNTSWPKHLIIRVVALPLIYGIVYLILGDKTGNTVGGIPITYAIVLPLYTLVLDAEVIHLFRHRKMRKLFCNVGIILSMILAAFVMVG